MSSAISYVYHLCSHLVQLFFWRHCSRFSGTDEDLAAACINLHLRICTIIVAGDHLQRIVHPTKNVCPKAGSKYLMLLLPPKENNQPEVNMLNAKVRTANTIRHDTIQYDSTDVSTRSRLFFDLTMVDLYILIPFVVLRHPSVAILSCLHVCKLPTFSG